MTRKKKIDGRMAVLASSLLEISLKEPPSLAGPRLFLEREQRTYPKLTELARKGRIKRRQKKGYR